jgi:hypothetical protein
MYEEGLFYKKAKKKKKELNVGPHKRYNKNVRIGYLVSK